MFYSAGNRSRHCSTNSGFDSCISIDSAIDIQTPPHNVANNQNSAKPTHDENSFPLTDVAKCTSFPNHEIESKEQMGSIGHPEKTNEELVDSSCVCPTSTQFQGDAEDSPIDDCSGLVHEETINLDQNPLMSNHSSKVKHLVYSISSVSNFKIQAVANSS